MSIDTRRIASSVNGRKLKYALSYYMRRVMNNDQILHILRQYSETQARHAHKIQELTQAALIFAALVVVGYLMHMYIEQEFARFMINAVWALCYFMCILYVARILIVAIYNRPLLCCEFNRDASC